MVCCVLFFLQAEDGIRDLVRSRGLGDVYKRQGKNSFEFNSQVFPIGFYFLVVKQNDIAETIKVLIDR